MKVLLFAPNASERMGGEAVLPLHYLRELTGMGVEASLLTHSRCRDELTSGPWASYDLHFVEDSLAEKTVWRASKGLPSPARSAGGLVSGTLTDLRLGAAARRLARKGDYDLVHQVTPVSPRAPAFVGRAGVPVVIGPMNGNMTFPPGFEAYADGSGGVTGAARGVSDRVNAAFPGKREAARLLVANDRTRRGLPDGVPPERVVTLVENGVDLSLWDDPEPLTAAHLDLVFVGRLVRWKAVDVLLDAVAQAPGEPRLRIVGDGAERASLEARAASLGLHGRVSFEGFQPKERVREIVTQARALVLPSVYECGGAVVLEAMACARPAIATDWGGPADYIEDGVTGLLVPPSSPTALRDGLARAIGELADTERARQMGLEGRRRVEADFAWQPKAAFVRGLYADVLAEREGARPAA